MRENFDFVSMENYSADMDDLTKRSSSIIQKLRKERDEAREMLARVLEAVGTPVRISDFLSEPPNITQERDTYDMSIVLRSVR